VVEVVVVDVVVVVAAHTWLVCVSQPATHS
jgi:hypothetical protein